MWFSYGRCWQIPRSMDLLGLGFLRRQLQDHSGLHKHIRSGLSHGYEWSSHFTQLQLNNEVFQLYIRGKCDYKSSSRFKYRDFCASGYLPERIWCYCEWQFKMDVQCKFEPSSGFTKRFYFGELRVKRVVYYSFEYFNQIEIVISLLILYKLFIRFLRFFNKD